MFQTVKLTAKRNSRNRRPSGQKKNQRITLHKKKKIKKKSTSFRESNTPLLSLELSRGRRVHKTHVSVVKPIHVLCCFGVPSLKYNNTRRSHVDCRRAHVQKAN